MGRTTYKGWTLERTYIPIELLKGAVVEGANKIISLFELWNNSRDKK